ncbi:hypothetical protein OPV22_018506 [Ensete ventricosum]|uniref:Uncharacterized protein n=1 Tax=Ensete ventricosum TaxID=4639 RepID=A0AAV8PJ24_ENSVE|nr:hypothetical protein OPV22_018506 [Ensete ventricosum]
MQLLRNPCRDPRTAGGICRPLVFLVKFNPHQQPFPQGSNVVIIPAGVSRQRRHRLISLLTAITKFCPSKGETYDNR